MCVNNCISVQFSTIFDVYIHKCGSLASLHDVCGHPGVEVGQPSDRWSKDRVLADIRHTTKCPYRQ